MQNQINKIQYVDLRSTHYWYDLNESDLSPELVIKDDEDIPMPDSIEPPTIETKKYVYKGYLKHGDFLILRDAHKAHLLFMNTIGIIEHIIPNAKHKEQLRTLGLPKEVMKGKGDVAACVRLAHGIRKDPKAWGMSTGPAIPAFVEMLKEVNAAFHADHKDALGLIEQYGLKVDIIERPKIPGINKIAVYDEHSEFIFFVGKEFANLERVNEVANDFIERMPKLLKFLKARNEYISIGRVRETNEITHYLSEWNGFTDAAVDTAIEDLEAALIYSDPIALFKALITQPELYEAPKVQGDKEMEGIPLWDCYSQLTETGVALRPKYRSYFRTPHEMSWADIEKHLGITEVFYNLHTEFQSLLDTINDDVVMPHHILRVCHQQIMERNKGVESYTPEGGFDIDE